MKKVEIFYSKLDERFPASVYQNYLTKLPLTLQEKNLSFVRWQDRYANLFGKLLLIEALKGNGYNNIPLEELKYNEYRKPYFESNLFFNISHSGEYVVCAFSDEVKLGTDVEKISDIDFNDFYKIMTPKQWLDIKSSKHPERRFFEYWTMKESTIKADGRGLSIPLHQIQDNDGKVCYENKQWYVKHIEIDKDYCTCLATDSSDIRISKYHIDFYRNKFNLV